MHIVSQLRDPHQGCQWDRAQTHSSLIPFVLEEANEVAHAIREGNKNNLKEELGDLLLQIMLHAQIAAEEEQFCLADIAKEISQKLIRRHPHVFQKTKAKNIKDIEKSWEEIKANEKPLAASNSPISDRLKLKIRSQNAINGAIIISKKVSKAGFQWPSIDYIWNKFNEEIDEFQEALTSKKNLDAQAELGDVIFTLINIAQWHNLSPEEGLAGTNQRFLERFSFIEKSLNGKIMGNSFQQLKSLWYQAKQNINSKD